MHRGARPIQRAFVVMAAVETNGWQFAYACYERFVIITLFVIKYKASISVAFNQVKSSLHLRFCNYHKAVVVLMCLSMSHQNTNRELDDNNIDSTVEEYEETVDIRKQQHHMEENSWYLRANCLNFSKKAICALRHQYQELKKQWAL